MYVAGKIADFIDSLMIVGFTTDINRLIRKLSSEFVIEYGTDEIHSEEMSFSSIAMPFAQDFECFDPGVDVFDGDSLVRQLAVERLLPCRQRTILLDLYEIRLF